MKNIFVRLAGVGVMLVLAKPAAAQWDIFVEPGVESQCGVVNTGSEAGGLEWAVRSCDGALVLISAGDLGFENAVVQSDGAVEIDGDFAGYVGYYSDADGFDTLWWVSERGYVMDFDLDEQQPFETTLLPEDFADVPCAAEDLWDGGGDCDSDDGDEEMEEADFLEDDELPGPSLGDLCGSGVSITIYLGGFLWMWGGGYRRRVMSGWYN
ncbi:MAG: hypothetical protein HJJLKODD_01605 [Phycisphaerae bacterium]|nr:hypothetical protein [Phycisphaerae bacterium]